MKIQDYSTALLPQEVIDLLNDVQTVINYGKYQFAVVTSRPTWTGRQGEGVLVINSTSFQLFFCTSDQSSTSWTVMAGS